MCVASLRERLAERFFFRLLGLYPPYLGAGVSVLHGKGDAHTIHVRMVLRFYNRNLFGTQFGGSLYSMCDPHFVFILVKNLGKDYLVWDKAASIDFLRPGRGHVTAVFHVPPAEIESIRKAADAGEKVEPEFVAEIKADTGEVVARVRKRLWVKRKTDAPRAGRAPAPGVPATQPQSDASGSSTASNGSARTTASSA